MESEDLFKDDDRLFLRVYKADCQLKQNSHIAPHAFEPKGGDGLSVNWSKYCTTPVACLSKGKIRTRATHGVGHFLVGGVRSINTLKIKYAPSKEDQSHTLIIGVPPCKRKADFLEMAQKLRKIFEWDFEPESSGDIKE
ncbi:MAG: hypothetical protein LKI18_03730 [Prevotella sp.]|jgi:hypothetical protein|nr:hypothetical protein [Prevotella sp.]